MTTAYIGRFAIDLPSRFTEGDLMDEAAASVLNDIQHRRVMARLRWMKDRGVVDAQTIQAKAVELMLEPLRPYNVAQDADEDDPIFAEALSIARTLISQKMAAEGLPPPKGLDDHAKALISAMPAQIERARLRVEARFKAALAVSAHTN